MSFISSIISWVIKKRIHQIELFIKHPHEVQHEWLDSLIGMAKSTEYGRKYDFKSITNAEIFKNRLPIQTYETIKPDIDRLLRGEQNILWPSEVKWFAKSSGTTADKSKFIPVTEEALEDCHYKGGKDMLSIYFNNCPDSQLFTGKSLVLGGSHRINKLSGESFYGDLSAVLTMNLPFWAEYYRTPGKDIALMDDWEEKIYQMAEKTVNENITQLAGVPTWTLALANKVLELSGKSNLMEVWPNLELYTHGAVSFKPYAEQFQKLIPNPNMYYQETYNASEGFFGIQDQKDKKEMLLMLDYGIYYEFMPLSELHKEEPQTLNLEQVELHTNYAIIISSNAGLWRYMMGDTIQFTSLDPYRICVSGRTKHFINVFGEEVIVDNAEEALATACKKSGAVASEYTVAPIFMSSDLKEGGHEWVIEFSSPPKDITAFTHNLDSRLREINTDYDAKRYKSIALKMPKVTSVPVGSFHKWLKTKGKLGGQHKVPRLYNTREYADEILKVIV